ncbi:MAG: hypothetical protein KatS3mg082_0744 [Nitrospiraceae bacterium]|nr:MAG: hypothetical protein KatS3mg082_0744 [Nitrospiraceae bacterium]
MARGARGDGLEPGTGVGEQEMPVIAEDLGDITARFIDRRQRPVPFNEGLPRIVGREGEQKIAVESVEKVTQVPGSSTDILVGIVDCLARPTARLFAASTA